jgi:hypothetical protein
MPSGHHTPGRRGDAPGRYQERHDEEPRAQPRSGGGRSEGYAHERDREQRGAGYAPHDWERNEESYRTVHSEPDWDPSRLSHDRRGFNYDAWPSNPRDDARRARYGYDDGHDVEQRRLHSSASAGSRGSSPEFEEQYRQHAQSLGSEIGNAGRRLIGKLKHIVRNPKNYTRSDERIREDVCDRLSVSRQVDPSELEVSVSAGEVTLTGTVSDRQMKFVAEEIADDVPGVHDVHNQLRVYRPAPTQTSSPVSINSQDAARGGKNIGRS